MKRAYIEVDSVEGFRDLVSAGQPVLVDYYTDWCGPCRALAPVVERIAAAHAGSLRVVKVNIEAAPELAERAKVREVPALHFYRDGQKVAVLNGFRTDEVLARELVRYGLIPGTASDRTERAPAPAEGPAARPSLAGRLLAKLGGGHTSERRTTHAAGLTGAASTSFRFIQSEPELDAVFHESFERNIALFLHDPWCPISARALRQMEQLGGGVPAIDVSQQRSLNAIVERRTGVRHQSPQVIVLRDGAAIWEASHGRVTGAGVRAALGRPGVGEAAESRIETPVQ